VTESLPGTADLHTCHYFFDGRQSRSHRGGHLAVSTCRELGRGRIIVRANKRDTWVADQPETPLAVGIRRSVSARAFALRSHRDLRRAGACWWDRIFVICITSNEMPGPYSPRTAALVPRSPSVPLPCGMDAPVVAPSTTGGLTGLSPAAAARGVRSKHPSPIASHPEPTFPATCCPTETANAEGLA
jgi:hypothetical protein